ncbi:hypothetical protein AArcSl_1617 [Halalkaliarchaeum desulfuricum]|uniref:Uncharacterized protein n=1 Tax=Halalkaliarchaeum desulfuricum TaxID=2055893 RepID=A0A343TJH4_9EURY|nr:hypothetical protein [Halalkaliarchaeum desulfuricum]AUX09246.1 hypothetical protein AArcSl_1617 [Halalkaliarchaeum desulfuricum]
MMDRWAYLASLGGMVTLADCASDSEPTAVETNPTPTQTQPATDSTPTEATAAETTPPETPTPATTAADISIHN